MYNRREDPRLRVPSPAVTRRQFRSPESQTAGLYSDGDPPSLDHRGFRSRDPSPGGIGRLSTSAPPGGVESLFHRRYRDFRGLDHGADTYGYASTGTGYVPTGRTPVTVVTAAKDTQPRRSRPASAVASPSSRLVNGDAWTQPTARGFGGRPRSFPEPRGVCRTDFGGGGQREYFAAPSCWQDLTPGGRRGQQAGSYREPLSPQNGVESVSDGVGSKMGLSSDQLKEGSFTCDDGYTWYSTLACLTCYLCTQLFRRPRILPCGHTFCSECLAQLKDDSIREARRIPGGHSTCTMESRQKADVSLQFVCPMPECHYSMRLINLSKWSTRNKTVADTVDAVRRIYENRQDACTQTDITMDSMLVTIPRSFMPMQVNRNTATATMAEAGSERALVRRNSASTASSFMDTVVHRAISMDSLSRSYIPQQHGTWRSYAAMLGMHILQQALHT